MTMQQLDALLVEDEMVVFRKANGEKLEMPNLTKIVNLYEKNKGTDAGNYAKEILSRGMGTLLIAEVMIDMTNETILNRFQNGDITKTMRHLNTYNIVLESHLDMAKKQFEGDFNTCIFAEFPYGVVIEREKYPTYKNIKCSIDVIKKIIKA